MKTLGTEQLLAKKFKRLELEPEWKGLLGNLAEVFVMLIFGNSGQGKTELCLQLTKILAKFGRVEWMLYEQGHAADIYDAVERNNLRGLPITWSDPWENLKPGVSLFDDLVTKMAKPKSAKYWFLDSYDSTRFTEDEILLIQKRFGKKKGIIWLSHASGRQPDTRVAKKIQHYGHISIYVKCYIAQCIFKNRFNGWDAKVIYEKRARELNPLFFEKQAEMNKNQTPKKNKKEKAPKVIDQ